jgi:PAS fold
MMLRKLPQPLAGKFSVLVNHGVFSLTISPIRDENGAIIGASTIARDITEQAAAHQIDNHAFIPG